MSARRRRATSSHAPRAGPVIAAGTTAAAAVRPASGALPVRSRMRSTPAVLNIVAIIRESDTVTRKLGYCGRPHSARKLFSVALRDVKAMHLILAQRVRSSPPRSDDVGIGPRDTTDPTDPAEPVAAIYPVALPQVYGYLLPRCGSVTVAEDLTAETFMAAVASCRRPPPPHVTVAWLIGI